MDRSVLKWLALGLALFLFLRFGWPLISGSSGDVERQPVVADTSAPADDARAAEQTCEIHGQRFDADLSTRGGSLRHDKMLDRKYRHDDGQPMDVVTTTLESRSPLRTDLRA